MIEITFSALGDNYSITLDTVVPMEPATVDADDAIKFFIEGTLGITGKPNSSDIESGINLLAGLTEYKGIIPVSNISHNMDLSSIPSDNYISVPTRVGDRP